MIGLMCKAPEGSKTRLAAGIGAERALALARAFLADGAALAAEAAARCDTRAVAFAAGTVALPGWDVRPQAKGDLGARMGAAIAAAGGPALLLGTDAPTLPVALASWPGARCAAGRMRRWCRRWMAATACWPWRGPCRPCSTTCHGARPA
jgi:glycosyltransferase A (GT-A) superfamily protein (DUF2064 family)